MSVIKKEFILEGLDCANCAMKIEGGIKSLYGIKDASVNFVTKKLKVEIDDENGMKSIMEEMKKIVHKIESDVLIIEQGSKSHFHDDRGNGHDQCNGHDHGHEHDQCNGHDHGHEHDHGGVHDKSELIRFGVGIVLFFIAIFVDSKNIMELPLFVISFLLIGGEVLLKSLRNIAKGQVFDENFLMSIATIGAFAIGEYPEGVAVMLFYQIGEFFQDAAVNNSRKSIKALMDIKPDFANLKFGSQTKRVSPDEVKIGDVIIVKPGERIPLDGMVIEGRSTLDTSALTGESLPREAEIGDGVLSGFINNNGVLTIEVTKTFGESTVSKILDLVENASTKKAPTEKFITKFAKYYTPIVVFVSVALAVIPPLFIEGAQFSDWLYRALVFLVVSCPCALVVSIPLGFFGGIGGASKNGILIKGSNYLEALNNVDTVVFDKTGTLTKGIFKVTAVKPSENMGEEELLKLAAYAESFSTHPIATSIQKAFGKEVDKSKIEDYEEIPGHGIKVKIDGKLILAGNRKLIDKENIKFEAANALGTIIYIAIEGIYGGHIIISDEVKEDAAKAIAGLKQMGIKKTVMLTGDLKVVGEKIGEQLMLDEVYTELLPDQKVEILEKLKKETVSKGKVVFVGDGINDAPVLARADIGVAMGGLGSDAAIEAADIVIMTDEPYKLITAIKIAKRTKTIVWQNIIFAFAVKALVLILGAGGLATLWEAVFADVGVALIAVLNSMRIMRVKNI